MLSLSHLQSANFVLIILFFLVYVPGVWLGPGLPALHIEDIFILIGAIVTLARSRSRLKAALETTAGRCIAASYAAFILWFTLVSALSVTAESDRVVVSGALFRCLSMLRGVCFSILVIGSIRSMLDIRHLAVGLLGLGALQLPILYCQKYNLLGVNEWLTPHFSLIYESSIYSLAGFRADGTFGNPNHATMGMVPIAALSYAMALWGWNKRIRLFSLLLSLGFMGFAILITQSRAGLLSMATAMLVVQAHAMWLRARRAFTQLAMVVLALGLILPTAILSDDLAYQRFNIFKSTQSFMGDESLSDRRLMWADGFAETRERLLWGNGLGAYARRGFFDSGYIDYLYAGGLIGIMTFLAIPLSCGFCLMARPRHVDLAPFFGVGLAVCGALVVSAFSHSMLFADKLWLLYLVILLAAAISPISTPPPPTAAFRRRALGGAP